MQSQSCKSHLSDDVIVTNDNSAHMTNGSTHCKHY